MTTKLLKGALTRIAAAAIAAVFFTPTASAAMAGVTPTAVWDNAASGYELNTVQGDDNLSISAGTGATVVNGTIHIASSGVYSGASIVLPSGLSKVSVLVKYSNFAGFSGREYYNNNDFYAPVFMSVEDSDGNVLGIGATNDATNLSWNWRTANGYHNNVLTRHFAEGPVLPAASGYALFSYDAAVGMRICLGTSLASLATAEKTNYHFSGRTLKNIGLGGEASASYADGWPNLVIEKVALFTDQYLSATDVADYLFPSQLNTIDYDVTVSALNDLFGTDSDIDVYLADGVTVTGDTTFNATTVRFHCDGSFTMTAPEGNTATFDFSDVTGGPVLKYIGFFPAVSGTTFTSNSIPTSVSDASSWKGTVWVRGAAMAGLNPDTYGNGSSTLRLSGCQGYFAQGSINCNVAIELLNDGYSYGIYVDNGFSRASNTPNNKVVINTLKGSGAVWTGGSAGTVLINVRDWSGFTGPLQFVNKILVLGEDIPAIDDFNVVGSIYICAGATLTATSQLRADGGIYVNGELSTPNVSATYIRDGTTIRVPDTGVLTLTNSSSVDDTTANYACIQGTGTLKLVSQGNYYRCVSTVNFPTNMIVQTELEGGFLLKNSGAEYTIGSFAGSGYVRSDWNQGDRNLRILQAKDTTYSGVFDAGIDRVGTVTVAPGVSTAGTLTLSARQTASNALVVESGAAVNLTGTWVGATTVAGTFSGTGTLTGDLTLSNGATIKVNDISDLLDVSGSLTATGAITIELPEGAEKGMVITTGSKPDISGATFTTKIGGVEKKLKVTATADGLKVGVQSLLIRIM